MANMEVLHFGVHPDNPAGAAGILGRSRGISKGVAEEVARFCHGWKSESVPRGMRRALMSFPLKLRLKSTPRGAHAVVRVTVEPIPHFQVLVMDRSLFRDFGFNPFAVDAAGVFPEWKPGVASQKQDCLPQRAKISPPPSPQDVGLIDESLHQLLVSQKLYLPIEAADEGSDRALSLLIEVLPDAVKQQLRFASFAPSPSNGYHLAANATPDCDFNGWQRLLMTLVGGELSPKLKAYTKKVRECLAYGDISSLLGEQRILTLDGGGEKPGSLDQPKAAAKVPAGPRIKTAVKPAGGKARAASLANDRLNRKVRPDSGMPFPRTAHWRGGKRQAPAPVVAVMLLILTVGSGWIYSQFFQDGSLTWQDIVSSSFRQDGSSTASAPTLLEVVNVAEVYDRQIIGVKRSAMIPGLNLEGDGHKRLHALREEAGRPLLAQIDLFLEIMAGGIRQGSRPDRELHRMQALGNQGEMLNVEWLRLLLAWHSLSEKVYWQDLAGLSDQAIRSRCDSLKTASPGDYEAVIEALEMGKRAGDLALQGQQAQGMGELLALFKESRYSDDWATRLYRAAEKVHPSTSPMTRAYRNSAFALVRLKRMEHIQGFADGAFTEFWVDGSWLPAAVRNVLPDLRRAAGAFNSGEAPDILAGTMSLYSYFEDPESLTRELAAGSMKFGRLRENAAIVFDGGTYEPYLMRIRHETVALQLRQGRDDAMLMDENSAGQVATFETVRAGGPGPDEWQMAAEALRAPFLVDWAHHLARTERLRQLKDLQAMESVWAEVERLVDALRRQARAGKNWSRGWRHLDGLLVRGLENRAIRKDPGGVVARRLADMVNWRAELREPAFLVPGKVTVRLNQETILAAGSCILEIQDETGRVRVSSPPFRMGPAAPAGTGWVGTGTFADGIPVAADEAFRIRVVSVDTGEEILEVDYPSLEDGLGPEGLSRSRPGEGGAIQGHPGASWWHALSLSRATCASGV